MALIYKACGKRDLFIYYPDISRHSPFRRYGMVILRESASKQSAEDIMEKWGLRELAEREKLVVAFPNPGKDGWKTEEPEEELQFLQEMKGTICNPDSLVLKFNEQGIPDFASMVGQWHLMNDTYYYIGIDEGASIVYELALKRPTEAAGIVCMGGNISEKSFTQVIQAPMPGWLLDAPGEMEEYLITQANQAEFVYETDGIKCYQNPINPLQSVHVSSGNSRKIDSAGFTDIYSNFLKKIRRTNTGANGNIELRTEFNKDTLEYYLEDTRLGCQDGIPRTWFVHVPGCIKQQNSKVPMMVFMHGGSDNPSEAADMSKFHEVGEEEGFITVYPWGSDSASWNCNLVESGKDDVAFLEALINYMKKHYPVDAGRIYLSGFSNGAGQAQVFAMLHPEMIAGICHIDSNWPGKRVGAVELKTEDVLPFVLGLEKKKEYDYLMPVWYTYGTREPSYPVYAGCSQQHQYDFWKSYNHIPIKETSPQDTPHPCGCGVEGDLRERCCPSKIYPDLCYDIQRFYTETGENLYNYVLVRDKGHDVAHMDARLGWEFVKQFRRNPDGSLSKVLEDFSHIED